MPALLVFLQDNQIFDYKLFPFNFSWEWLPEAAAWRNKNEHRECIWLNERINMNIMYSWLLSRISSYRSKNNLHKAIIKLLKCGLNCNLRWTSLWAYELCLDSGSYTVLNWLWQCLDRSWFFFPSSFTIVSLHLKMVWYMFNYIKICI